MNWCEQTRALLEAGEQVVAVTIAGIRGSSPREIGAKMLVTRHASIGTIGGGRLEYECTAIARESLDSQPGIALRRIPLGPSLGQCCGGMVDIYFERNDHVPTWLKTLNQGASTASRILSDVVTGEKQVSDVDSPLIGELADNPNVRALHEQRRAGRIGDWLLEFVGPPQLCVTVFGAGHVGKCIVSLLSSLSCQVRWIDSRASMFPTVTGNVNAILSADPIHEVQRSPTDSYYLVLTHDHQLDFALCDQILRRDDAQYVGVIGSKTKRRRFEKRFRAIGVRSSVVNQLHCPIGIAELTGKAPEEIAISVVADILRRRDQQRAMTAATRREPLSAIGI